MTTHQNTAPDDAPGYYEVMETAIRELPVEKGLIQAAEIRRQIDVLDSRTPQLAAGAESSARLVQAKAVLRESRAC